jgi:transcriptional regulator with XRE-family HTH domain
MSLREMRTQNGVTQEQLADKANVSQSMIQAIETGRRKGSVSTLISIAGALNVSVDELLRAMDNTESTELEEAR